MVAGADVAVVGSPCPGTLELCVDGLGVVIDELCARFEALGLEALEEAAASLRDGVEAP